MFRPEDDSFHERTDDPYWNESGWFSVLHPERNLSGWVYMYHRPNMNLSAGGVALWDPTGEHAYDCVYHRYDELEAIPKDADMYNFALGNGLSVETLQLQKSYGLSYKNDGCELQLTWESLMDPVPQALKKTEADDPFDEWGSFNYTQGGRMKGSIRAAGETYEIDCLSMRDHSWGPRRTRPFFPRGNFCWSIGPEAAFVVWSISHLPPDQDPLIGTTESTLPGLGWYRKDGAVHLIVEATSRVERGDDGRPLGVALDAIDEEGRELHAEGRSRNLLKWHGHISGDLYTNWCLASWKFDGQEASGEIQDYSMLQAQRRFLRSRLKG